MNTRKIIMLCGAFVLALGATFGAGVAMAGTVTLTNPDGSGPDIALGAVTAGSEQYDLGATITAAVTGATVAEGIVTVPGLVTGTTSVSSNTLSALATGNYQSTSVDTLTLLPLGVLTSDATIDGIAVLDFQINGGSQVTSTVTSSTLSQTLDDFTIGSANLNSNTVLAQTTLNSEVSDVSGQVPLTYESNTLGNAILDFGGPTTASGTGSIAVFNGQTNVASGDDSGSQASLSGDNITQLIENTDTTPNDEVVTSSPSVSSNDMAANFLGNTADNAVDLEPGTNVAFNGSVSLFNAQSNFDDGTTNGGAAVVADNSSSTISSTITTTAGAGSETLTGTLTVDHNSISSFAVGNNAANNDGNSTSGNTITIGDGLDYTGTGANSDNAVAVNSSALSDTVNADLVLLNVQVNDNFIGGGGSLTGLGAQTISAQITATVDNVVGGNVDPAFNSITSTSQGAEAYNAIDAGGPNTATFDGSASIGSTQINSNTNFSAKVNDALIEASIAQGADLVVTDSAVEVSSNTVGAYAGAGSATNEISIEATTLTAGDPTELASLTAERDPGNGNDISDHASSGGAVINNMQNSYSDGGATTVALNNGTEITLLAAYDTQVSGDSLTEDLNTVEAIARTNSGASLISLTATTLNGSAGVLTEQTADNPTSATVNDPALLLWAVTNSGGADAVTASDLSLSDNLVRSLAYGNDGSGTITAGATTFNLEDNNFSPATSITVDNAVDQPFDADAPNAPDVNGALAVLTDQDVSGDVTALTSGDTPIFLHVGSDGGDMSGSSARADANAYVAAARGNVSGNGISIQTTTTAQTGADQYEAAANITNIQTVEDGVTISADSTSGSSNTILLLVEGSVDSSGVSADNNLLTAIAGGNYSTNTMEASGVTISDPFFDNTLNGATWDGTAGTIETDAAFSITNAQFVGSSSITAQVDPVLNGQVAILVQAGSDGGASVINSAVSASGNTLSSTAVANSENSTLGFDPVTLDASASINNFQVSLADVTAETIDGDGHVGVEISVNGDVTDSTLTVDNTLFNADATGNAASNALNASATTIIDGSGAGPTTVSFYDLSDGSDSANGTFSMLNNQLIADGTIQATALGSDIIVCPGQCSPAVTGSALSVSGNTQQAIALGNTANDSIDIAMTDGGKATATASLTSFQGNDDTTVISSANFVASSIGQVTDSSLTMDGNSNLSLSVINDVTNTLSASADAVLSSNSGLGGNANFDTGTGVITATADYALGNVQDASGTVSAFATTLIFNNDSAGTEDTIDSAISLSNNHTTAEADANRASNTLSLNAGSTLAAGGALFNAQDSSATVTANASANIGYTTDAAFNGSTVKANSNTTAAVANGNAVSNALNADAGALYDGAVTSASSSNSGGVLNATAQYALLNAQENNGDVSATTTGSVQVGNTVLPLGNTGGVSGSSADVSNNTFLAQATGNSAGNTISMTGLVGGTASAALMNSQENSNNTVSATVTGVTMGINANGVVSSSMTVNNNTIAATAVGNSAVNVITTH